MSALTRRLLGRLRREEGAVIPMVALLLIVILGFAAFAIDVSSLYFDQRHLQMQADSAVLAAANQYVQGSGGCTANQSQIQAVGNNYAGVGSNPVSSNNEPGTVTGGVTVNCSAGTIDATLTNTGPPAFFSGILGAHPTVSAHARASLLQVSEDGGSYVMPYAIPQGQAVYNNKLIQITVNSSSVKQALVCDGSGASNATSSTEMYNLQVSGCPTTQINPGGTTCPPTQLSPPSCVYQFTGVDESSGFDAGHVYKFENGSPWPNNDTCTNPNPIPTNNYAQYLANGTLVAGDPRVITVLVVPNNSLSTTTHLVPIMGYATFYMAGWDHDPCIGKSDPKNPGPQGDAGTIWGYFISYTQPESSSVSGSSTTPCNPNPTQAWTYNCTYALTQ
jgi:Flp pilus assembly protein TadG